VLGSHRPGSHVARLLRTAVLLTVLLTMLRQPPSLFGAQPGGTLSQWEVSGIWQAEQGNGYHPSFNFQQSSTTITGIATLPAAEQRGPATVVPVDP
jgi:hypothetical protein